MKIILFLKCGHPSGSIALGKPTFPDGTDGFSSEFMIMNTLLSTYPEACMNSIGFKGAAGVAVPVLNGEG
ncbi:hypothetical protein [Lautropia mirabilis]|uniref:hypothetical protein n=1 Tax=Lautropia mirabilis TaxID=47671 RepID=UPI0028F10EB6|nr:hypothetical protein [Lautropia mirabilis]